MLEMISEYSEDVSWKGVEFKTTFADYREVDGLMFPFQTDLYANDRLIRKFYTQEVHINQPIEDWVFEKDQNIIRRNMRLFSQAVVNQDIDAIVNAYTEDGKISPTMRISWKALKPLRSYWSPAQTQQVEHPTTNSCLQKSKFLGKEAYDYGNYEGKTLNADGSEASWKGKYVVVWKEVEEDVWKMYLDIWNRVRK